MKFPGTFLSIIALAWAGAAVLRTPKVPFSVVAYLFFHAVFTLTCWWAAQRFPIASGSYQLAYAVMVAPVLLLAIWLAATLCAGAPLAWGLAGGAAQAIALCLILQSELLKAYRVPTLPASLWLMLAEAAIFCACGAAFLASLFVPHDPAIRAVRLALGAFWSFQGYFLLAFVSGLSQRRMAWAAHNAWAPAMAGVVAFCWLAWTLGGLQGEVARSGAREPSVERLRTVEVGTRKVAR